MNTSKLLVMVLVLQLLILAGQWTRESGPGTPAMAQIPDPGNQRIQMIEELKNLNGKVDKIVGILSDGDLQVRVVMPDENKRAGSAK